MGTHTFASIAAPHRPLNAIKSAKSRVDAHKKVEARRRNKLKELTSALRADLPQLHPKCSQAEIFEAAAAEIIKLREELRLAKLSLEEHDPPATESSPSPKRRRGNTTARKDDASQNSKESWCQKDWSREIAELFAAPIASSVLDAACAEVNLSRRPQESRRTPKGANADLSDQMLSISAPFSRSLTEDELKDEDVLSLINIDTSNLPSVDEMNALGDNELFSLIDVDLCNLIAPA